MPDFIDLRSDTVTKPSEGMRKAMYDAEVGDDVYGEDPTVNKLEKYCAELFGKEAALFVPTGVMGNQICLNILTNPADEVICEAKAHIFHYESGSPAMLSGIQMYPVYTSNGVMKPAQVEPLIRPTSAYYMPQTRIIEIENTHNMAGGIIQPIETIRAMRILADKYKLYMHMDGARLWNASAASGIPLDEYASYFETVSCCLSKGLGAPVGSIIFGTKDLMKKAHRMRKALGGGMRQAGILAAAALYALENNLPKLTDDHHKAKLIADKLAQLENVKIDMSTVQTNIIIFEVVNGNIEEIIKSCKEKGLLISTGQPGTLRIVTHLDISFEQVKKACEILKSSL